MTQLKRTHIGIECSIHEEHPKWIISVKYRLKDHPSSLLIARETTLDGAKRIADDEVKKSGHVCNGPCK